jgi:hypothetical protein
MASSSFAAPGSFEPAGDALLAPFGGFDGLAMTPRITVLRPLHSREARLS